MRLKSMAYKKFLSNFVAAVFFINSLPAQMAYAEPIGTHELIESPSFTHDELIARKLALEHELNTQNFLLQNRNIVDEIQSDISDTWGIKPFKISVATSPWVNTNDLTVEVADAKGNATVKWGNVEHEAYFNKTTNQIFIRFQQKKGRRITPEQSAAVVSSASPMITAGVISYTWKLQFGVNDGQYRLMSFERKSKRNTRSSKGAYYFSKDGLVERDTSEIRSSSYSSKSETLYTYMSIGGRSLVASTASKSTYTTNGQIHVLAGSTDQPSNDTQNAYVHRNSGRTYFSYNELGIQTARINVSSGTRSGDTTHNASYMRWDSWNGDGIRQTTAYATGLSEEATALIQSTDDYDAVDKYARTKTEHYFGDASRSWTNFRFSIQYAKNHESQFEARFVQSSGGHKTGHIVQGRPDVLSGETDDILFKLGQSANGHYLYYGEAYKSASMRLLTLDAATSEGDVLYDPIQPEYLGYGLGFSKWYTNEVGQFEQVTVLVDYPGENTVSLDDKEYSITFDEEGNVHLDETDDAARINKARADIRAIFDAIQVPGTIKESDFPRWDQSLKSAYDTVRGILLELKQNLTDIGGDSATIQVTGGPMDAVRLDSEAAGWMHELYKEIMTADVELTDGSVVPITILTDILLTELRNAGHPLYGPEDSFLVLPGLTPSIVGTFHPGDGHYLMRVFGNVAARFLNSPSARDRRDIIIRFVKAYQDEVTIDGNIDPELFREALINYFPQVINPPVAVSLSSADWGGSENMDPYIQPEGNDAASLAAIYRKLSGAFKSCLDDEASCGYSPFQEPTGVNTIR